MPPSITSEASAPTIVSLPSPALMLSLPVPAVIESAKRPPVISSAPLAVVTMSPRSLKVTSNASPVWLERFTVTAAPLPVTTMFSTPSRFKSPVGV